MRGKNSTHLAQHGIQWFGLLSSVKWKRRSIPQHSHTPSPPTHPANTSSKYFTDFFTNASLLQVRSIQPWRVSPCNDEVNQTTWMMGSR